MTWLTWRQQRDELRRVHSIHQFASAMYGVIQAFYELRVAQDQDSGPAWTANSAGVMAEKFGWLVTEYIHGKTQLSLFRCTVKA